MRKKKPKRPAEPRPLLSDTAKERITIAIILVAASVLLLLNLGNQYLWQDEAQTALVSKTVLTHGVPVGYDGKNYFSQQTGAEYGRNYIWKWHTWFPFYLLAAFFRIFGVTTFVARFPFALFGIATVMLTYYAGRRLWGTRRAAFLSAGVLLVTVPFFLLARQCRLYSPAMFFSLLGLYAYVGILEKRRRSSLLFGVAAVLLFHTFYVYYASLLAAVIAHSLIFRRDRALRVVILSAITLAVNAPWIIWLSSMGYVTEYQSNLFDLTKAWGQTQHFVYLIGKHVFPWWLLLVPVIPLGVSWFRNGRFPRPNAEPAGKLILMLLFGVFTVAAIALSAPAPFFRYVAPLVPVCALLMGLILESGARLHPILAALALIALLATGRMPDYLYELTHDYNGPVEGIVKYLKAHAKPDDIVAVTYEDLPIKFYTNLRVVGGLTGEDLSPAKKAKWVIIRRNFVGGGTDMANLRYFAENLHAEEFERIELDYPDIPFENREGPEEHRFRTAEGEYPVVIFHKLMD